MEAGEAFEAIWGPAEIHSGGGAVQVPLDRSWYVVLSNLDSVASTLVSDLRVQVTSLDETTWSSDPEPLEVHYRIPPGDYLAVELTP